MIGTTAGALAYVAPHTGAWIETSSRTNWDLRNAVAPHTGAWIETVRGKAFLFDHVAPHTGAWIETLLPKFYRPR